MNRKEDIIHASTNTNWRDLRAIHMDRSHLPINLPYPGITYVKIAFRTRLVMTRWTPDILISSDTGVGGGASALGRSTP